MFHDSLTSIVRRSSTPRHAVYLGILLAIVFVLSIASVELRLPGFSTAPWWPAAGFAAIATLSSRGRGFATAGLILVVTTGANLVVGTVWWVAIGFGVANAAEAWIIAAIMRFRRAHGRAFGAGDIVRFLLAAAAGGIVIGVIAAAFVKLSGGAFTDTALHVAASHASAVLLITALGLLPRSAFTIRRPLMLGAQTLVLAVTVVVAFAPEQRFPLAFLPLPALAWAVFRFGSGIVLVEIGLVGGAILLLSFAGRGPFVDAAGGDAALLIRLVQIYAGSLIVSMLPLALMQDGQSALLSRLSAREQLLRGVVVNAHAGFVVVQRDDTGFHVVESNPTGMRLLDPWVRDTRNGLMLDRAELAARLPAGRDEDWTGEWEFADGVLLELVVTTVSGERDLFLVQAIDATEQRAASQALSDALEHEREALERLRDLAAQKDQFVSSVSHELRTPVTSILGYAEELADGDLDDVDRRNVEVILRNSRRLAELVDNLLSLSRTAAEPTFTAAPVSVAQVVAGCVEELAPLARVSGISLVADVSSELEVLGDTLWVDRVVSNLVTNAIKFTPDGGTVTVTAAAIDSATVRVEVADTGRGVPPAQLEKVFERFYRITDSDRGFVAGTGLGLPIVRDLVTRMGGTVILTSDGRRGTIAVVELPAAVVDAGTVTTAR
jgi:two-component system, OmpR family, phosphate regulon sensor histidine kinase PhoR